MKRMLVLHIKHLTRFYDIALRNEVRNALALHQRRPSVSYNLKIQSRPQKWMRLLLCRTMKVSITFYFHTLLNMLLLRHLKQSHKGVTP